MGRKGYVVGGCPQGGIPKHAIVPGGVPSNGLDLSSGDHRVPEARVNGSALAQLRLHGSGRHWLGEPCSYPLLVFFSDFFRIVNLMHTGAQTTQQPPETQEYAFEEQGDG